MGPLACLPRPASPQTARAVPFSAAGTHYDEQIEDALLTTGARPDARPFRAGDVSFHDADCLHTAGANTTTTPRRVLSSAYYADGAHVTNRPTALSGTWTQFLPGVSPGDNATSPLNPVVGSAAPPERRQPLPRP